MPTIQLTSQPIKHSKHFVAFSGEDRCIFNVTIHMNESNMVCNTYSFCRMSQDSGIWSSKDMNELVGESKTLLNRIE
ncbi:hypothetical protein BLOT_006183 [Blomia tropicalis]|nr:hypothetical protein BLOT_006183 [Blomia tropicalis]